MRLRRFWPLGGVVLALSAYACVESSSSWDGELASASAGQVTRAALLEHLGGEIVASQGAFVEAAEGLEAATRAWAESGAEEDRLAAQGAWRTAMALWQRLEVLQVGPAASTTNDAPGALGLREPIYSWPITNPCRVDQQLASEGYADPASLAEGVPNDQGLDALEYLLFYDGDDNACAPQNVPNSDGSWAPIVGELSARRGAYAAVAATLLRSDAETLRDAWTGEDGFLAELTEAGGDGELFDSEQKGINALVDALFYVEKSTKDMKLAVVLGFTDCSAERCPERAELGRSGFSLRAIAENFAAFRLVLTGGENGPGFADFARTVGQDELADRMLRELEATEAAHAAIESGSLVAALESEPAKVEALYFALQEQMTTLKTDFVSILDLELPKVVEGDND